MTAGSQSAEPPAHVPRGQETHARGGSRGREGPRGRGRLGVARDPRRERPLLAAASGGGRGLVLCEGLPASALSSPPCRQIAPGGEWWGVSCTSGASQGEPQMRHSGPFYPTRRVVETRCAHLGGSLWAAAATLSPEAAWAWGAAALVWLISLSRSPGL